MAGQMAQALQPQAQQAAAAPAQTPPPLMPSGAAYYVAVNGQQAGPFDLATLQQRIAAGQISAETLVWKAGMPAWAQAQTLGELSSLFAPKPPPLP